MTLFWLITGSLVALGIARYNQSNKLFWTLMLSFLVGIAVASVYNKLSSGEENNQGKVELTQAYPTQDVFSILALVDNYLVPNENTAMSIEPALVSKDNTPDLSEFDFTLLSQWVIPAATPPPQILQL